ncbi:unnamed protein product [Ectocarpus sp. CCAP 1310/34]|nr:unnamed protein product [Ectocarpus sp. CCAP 1310/34]
MSTEALAAMAYDVERLATGNDDVHREIARMVSDPAIAGLSYDLRWRRRHLDHEDIRQVLRGVARGPGSRQTRAHHQELLGWGTQLRPSRRPWTRWLRPLHVSEAPRLRSWLSAWSPGRAIRDVHREIARMVSDPAIAGLSYDPTSGGGDGTWTTRTSVKFFAELLEDQVLDKLVRITRSFSDGGPNYGHLVALGPDGFVLCTCLRLRVYGLGCRHGLRAVRDTDFGFNGGCIASRWRDSTQPWTMEHLAAKRAAPANTAAGVPGGMPPAPVDPVFFSNSKPTARVSNWASCVAFGKELASLMTDVDAVAPCQRVLNNLTNYAKQLIEVEARSQHEATTNRIFTGVVARPVTATDPPEGGPVGAGPGGGRGRGNGRGRGRGGALIHETRNYLNLNVLSKQYQCPLDKCAIDVSACSRTNS